MSTPTVTDLESLHANLALSTAQLDDAIKYRMATDNRIKAAQREGLPDLVLLPFFGQLEYAKSMERKARSTVEMYAKQHPMADWVKETRGISLYGFARLFGATGPLDRFPRHSSLWHYLGLHVEDGKAPRLKPGTQSDFSPHKRATAFLLATGPVTWGGPYREIYDRRKAYEQEKHPDLSLGHIELRARRYVAKRILRDMWREWQKRVVV